MKQNYLLGKKIKQQFPIFNNNFCTKNNSSLPLVYLDSAVSTHKPQVVIDAMKRHMEFEYGSVHRGAYGLSMMSSQMLEEVRGKIAQFIGKNISSQQIIFTKNATESLNILANGCAKEILSEEHRIVLPVSEHHANFVPWQQAALNKNCEIAYIPLLGRSQNELTLNLTEAKKLITKNTRVVTLSSMGNVLGQINPVAEIIEMAKKVGAYVFLDCSQSASCFEEDYFAMGAHAVCFSAHKMYGPSGIGILALTPELMERLPPLLFGGGMISSVTLEESSWTTGPAKFEAGTPPITEAVGFGAAIDWVLQLGRANIHAHASKLNTQFLQGLQKIPNIEIYSPQSGAETLVSFLHKNIHAHDLATILDSHHVCMRAGHHCAWPLVRFLGVDALVRCSFAAYSDEDDVAIALQAIKETIKFI